MLVRADGTQAIRYRIVGSYAAAYNVHGIMRIRGMWTKFITSFRKIQMLSQFAGIVNVYNKRRLRSYRSPCGGHRPCPW